MKLLHIIMRMFFVFLLSNGTVQPMLTRGASILAKGDGKKSLTSMFGNLSLKSVPQTLSFQQKLQQSKKIFSKDYSKFSQFYRPNYVQRRWFNGTNGGEFDGVDLDSDLRMLKRKQLRALAEKLGCSEEEVQLRIEQQHKRLIRELIEENPQDINAQDSAGNTPLVLALRLENYAAIRFLLEMKADITIPDFEGRTPLHSALSSGDIRYVCMLLKAGVNPNVVHKVHREEEYFGEKVTVEYLITPLSVAVEKNNFSCVKELLEMGANPEFPTKKDKEYLIELALANGNEEIAHLLEIYPLF